MTADARARARNRGKEHERRTAQLLGGERVPAPGRERGFAPDVAHPRWAIECKAWKSVPKYLSGAMEQATKSARGAQVPIVVIHVAGKRYEDAYVVVALDDFIAITGGENDAG